MKMPPDIKLYEHKWQNTSNYIFKFADDTTVLGLISNNDEAVYRQEVGNLAVWCSEYNLSLNIKKKRDDH